MCHLLGRPLGTHTQLSCLSGLVGVLPGQAHTQIPGCRRKWALGRNHTVCVHKLGRGPTRQLGRGTTLSPSPGHSPPKAGSRACSAHRFPHGRPRRVRVGEDGGRARREQRWW